MRALVLLFLLSVLAVPATAQNKAAVERQYQSWLEQTIWPQARRKGVSRGTFEAAFAGVSLNWKLPDLVPPGTKPKVENAQRQSEFGAPSRYFARNTIDGATRVGRQMAQRHAAALQRSEARTGVPGQIVLAIWGRESAYGQAKIPHDVFEVLGTKGFMSTRAAYFTEELIAAL
jgi:membrane-bound lytic murein transglycosylase B